MKIISFAGSNSKQSINKKLVNYVTTLFDSTDTEILDLNDFKTDIFSIDKEDNNGIPLIIKEFASKIDKANLLIVSLAEHNGSYSVAFKNIYDWLSRIPNRKVFNNKPMLLLATSPGARGASSVLSAAKERFPRDGAEILETFSLPKFQENFSDKKGIIDIKLYQELLEKIKRIEKKL